MKTIVVCGDSFNYGIGCTDLATQPYGVLVAKKLNFELIRLARGSSSNFTTHLQAEYAAEKINPKPNIIIIGSTSYDRVEWITENAKDVPRHLGAENIVYKQYPPHYFAQDKTNGPMPFWFDGKEHHIPCILSEQISALPDYLEKMKKHPNYEYYDRLKTEPNKKIQTIIDWYVNVVHHDIKANYDIGVLLKAYLRVKKANIHCIVLSPDKRIHELLPEQDVLDINWFSLAKQYPDTIGSLHASEEAHALIADQLINKIISNNYD